MKYTRLFLFLLAIPACLSAQNRLPQLPVSTRMDALITKLSADTRVNADSALKTLSRWQGYPEIKDKGRNYVFYYHDERIGKIPLRVYIPPAYNNTKPNACVMVLHGAVSISKFSDIDTLGNTDEDILVDPLKTQGYIIIQPIADRLSGFTWGGKMQPYGEPYRWNITYQILPRIITGLKRILNIDDNRLFALGHSDGADGAVGLAVYKPDQFAGVVAYNTMFNNLFSRDYYIRNIQNLPVYEVHSDKDQLRRIAVNRQIIDSLKKYTSQLTYKEYAGYEHYDKHLSIDEPFADKFMKGLLRDPFQKNMYWETTQNSPYNSTGWLSITADTTMNAAAWHKPFEVKYKDFMERNNAWMDYHTYNPLKSAAVKANYSNNVFTLQTSGVTEVELKINPQMVDLKRPVTIMANGRQVFKGPIAADKAYLLNNFAHTADRQALWVSSIKVKIN